MRPRLEEHPNGRVEFVVDVEVSWFFPFVSEVQRQLGLDASMPVFGPESVRIELQRRGVRVLACYEEGAVRLRGLSPRGDELTWYTAPRLRTWFLATASQDPLPAYAKAG